MPRVTRINVFPVKGLRGVSVESAVVTETGFELDRTWSVIDESGERYAANEALSNRKLSALTTLTVTLEGTETLCIRAPSEFDLPPLRVPIAAADYADRRRVLVTSSGKSTSDPNNAGWVLGEMECRSAGPEASEWLSTYFNDPTVDRQKKKKPRATYTLARSMDVAACRNMINYPPIFPIIAKAQKGAGDAHWRKSWTRFQDFAPFLIASEASARHLSELAGVTYPIEPFRASIIVDGDGISAWEEETWRTVAVGADVLLTKIKECPRCTVPCRSPATGEYLFPGSEKLKLWKTLKKAFPGKAGDAEWSTWKGVFFGVYFGHSGSGGSGGNVGKTISVGDEIVAGERTTWDAHLTRSRTPWVVVFFAVLVAIVAYVFGPQSISKMLGL